MYTPNTKHCYYSTHHKFEDKRKKDKGKEKRREQRKREKREKEKTEVDFIKRRLSANFQRQYARRGQQQDN